VFGIFTSRAMRERGRYQLQLMKTRNSGGVGSKIDLGFNLDTLRIEDLGEDDDGYASAGASSSSGGIMDRIKRGSGTTTPDSAITDPSAGAGVGKVRAEADSTKLKNFINNLTE
jgi:hypothetical protein